MASLYMAAMAGTQAGSDAASLAVQVNGEPRRVPAGLDIAALVRQLGLDPARIAVERNLEIVPRSMLGEVKVEDGDRFEFVTFVGGG